MTMNIAIIGGGPAGSSAALALLRRGHRVTILERARFPRSKVCGEFISPAATDLLESILPADRLVLAGAQRVREFVLELDGKEARWTMPGPAWVLSRATLDSLLLETARHQGATVLQPTGVSGVRYGHDQVNLRLDGGEELSADAVVHADGIGRHDPAGPIRMRTDVVGLKCHLSGAAADAREIRLRSAPGAYIGMVRVERGIATHALVASKGLVARHRGDADELLRELWPGFDPSWRRSAWLSCGIAVGGYVRPGHTRSFRVGNAAGAVEPVGGEGIGLGLWAGATLGELLNGADLRGSQEEFARRYRARLRWRARACRLAAAVLMRPKLVGAAWPVLAARLLRRPVIGAWYRLSGKPGAILGGSVRPDPALP